MNFPLRRPGSDLLRCVTATGLLVSLGTVAPPANATVYTWMGTGTTTTPTSGNWSIPADWSGGLPASAATTELDFASSTTSYVSTNNIGTVPFLLNILTDSTGSGTGTVTVAGTQLQFISNGATAPVINQNSAGTLSISAPLDLANGLTIQDTAVGQVSLSGAITDSGSLTIDLSTSGQKGLVINNANSTYSGGTNLQAGSLVVDAPGPLGSGSLGTGTLTLGGVVAPKLTFSTTGGTYNNNLAVTGTNATIEADVTTTITGTANTNIATGETLLLQNTTSTAVVGTLTSAIVGGGSLQRYNVQLGSWILSGNNMYTGTTSVTAGLLAITGTTSGQGSYSVTGNGATYGVLAGSGTIGLAAGKTLIVTGGAAGNGVLEPTNAATPTASSIGMLTVVSAGAGSSVALGSLSTLSIAVGSSSSSSELVVGSLTQAVALTLTSTNTLALTGTFDGSNYTIAHAFGAQTGTFANLIVNGTTEPSASTFSANGFTYNVDYGVADAVGGTDIELVAMTVPEPSAFAGILTLLAIGGLYCRARARLGRLA
jgi:autotransporter-associated beta strand protein